jgi:prophage regulatory protein
MNTATEEIEFIRLPRVIALVGLSQTTIYDMANAGRFPKQVKVGGRAVAWIKSEVLQWSQERVAAARGDQPSASSESR